VLARIIYIILLFVVSARTNKRHHHHRRLKMHFSMLSYLSVSGDIARSAWFQQSKLADITKYKKYVHGLRKSRCVNCGSAEICSRGQRKSLCVNCGCAEICSHGRRRDNCQDCRGQRKKKSKYKSPASTAMMATNDRDKTDQAYKMKISFICSDLVSRE
jgi:hypothetical protein